MRRRVQPITREIPAFEMSASYDGVSNFISPASNILSSDENEIWHSFQFAPVTLHIDLGMRRRLRQVYLLPNMKPSTATVRHELTLRDSNRSSTYVYEGLASDGQWICFELNDSASSFDINTTHSPSWISWKKLRVLESIQTQPPSLLQTVGGGGPSRA